MSIAIRWPVWANEYHSFLLAQQIQSLGLNVPRKVLAEIYGEDLIEPANIQTIELESNDRESNEYRITSNENPKNVTRYSLLDTQGLWKPSRLDIEEVQQLWRTNDWTKEGLLELLRSHFNIFQIKEIQTFSQEQFHQFKQALTNNEAKKIFIK